MLANPVPGVHRVPGTFVPVVTVPWTSRFEDAKKVASSKGMTAASTSIPVRVRGPPSLSSNSLPRGSSTRGLRLAEFKLFRFPSRPSEIGVITVFYRGYEEELDPWILYNRSIVSGH